MRKGLFCAILLFFTSCFINAQTPKTPKREVRAVWLTTLKNLDWPKSYARSASSIEKQKQDLRNILDKYQQANINTVLFQAVVRASAVYPSNIYPWDACMSGRFGVRPGYDPLAFAIEECHKRGMEIQAWMATLPVGPYNGAAAKRLRRKGYKMFKIEGDAFLDPSAESTGELVASVAREITTHYDIDGIHLDYIRYPETLPAPRNAYIAQWRRNKITAVVRKVHDAVKAEKPWVKISCSPIGKYSDLSRYSSRNWNARDRVSQDAQLWLRKGLMDQLYPMMYFRGDDFYPFAADWAEHTYNGTIAAGLGTYLLDDRQTKQYKWKLSDISREMMVARSMNLGTAHFRSKFLLDNYKGIYDFVANFYSPTPALIPVMGNHKKNDLPTPTKLKIQDNRLYIETNGKVQGIGKRLFFNVYGSDEWPVDVNNAENLLLARANSSVISLPENTPWQPAYYAVTVMDRYGNESQPVQSWERPQSMKGQLPCDGRTVKIGNNTNHKNGYLEITSMENTLIKRLPISSVDKDGKVNVERLPNGIYNLSLSYKHSRKKTINEKLGFFIIRRGL